MVAPHSVIVHSCPCSSCNFGMVWSLWGMWRTVQIAWCSVRSKCAVMTWTPYEVYSSPWAADVNCDLRVLVSLMTCGCFDSMWWLHATVGCWPTVCESGLIERQQGEPFRRVPSLCCRSAYITHCSQIQSNRTFPCIKKLQRTHCWLKTSWVWPCCSSCGYALCILT